MKKTLIILICLSISSFLFPQHITNTDFKHSSKKRILLNQSDIISIPVELESKILSGKLIQNISEKKYMQANGLSSPEESTEQVVIYVSEYPSADQIASLRLLDADCYLDVWTPPLPNHPYGFFIAEIPADKFIETISLSFIKKIDTGEYENFPHNNNGVISINADDVWLAGFDGTGVKVGVLDSGIDTYYDGSEFPSSFERMDYSAYPTTDPGVENTVTGHGTHVAGTILARGTNSIGRSDEGNGSTPFKGSAPDADLTFLKIGSDATGGASTDAMIAAMDAAVNIYNVDVLSMSYGGWYTYHDGSSATEQKVDWVYSQGVPFFLSAGNEGDNKRHYSETVNANSETGFIRVDVTSASSNSTALFFNLVWFDGSSRNDLNLKYYNSSQIELTDVTHYTTTQSVRGTESQNSNYNYYVPTGTSIYYLKVENNSNNDQQFHIYEDWGDFKVTFQIDDPFYTIGQPASADNGFAVGSYVTRVSWIASDGSGPWSYSGFTLNDIASYSSRGPRVNGGAQKPNIAAPGHAIISLRDTDVITVWDGGWIDNDGTTGSGGTNYYVMTGTSMACPIAAGCGALLLDKVPTATPQEVYDAIQNSGNTSGTGTVPNDTWGYGKFDVLAASQLAPFPVELSSFTAKVLRNGGVKLDWRTETEVNNYGFEVERASSSTAPIQGWEKLGFVEGNGNSNSPKDYSFVDDEVLSGNYSYRLKQIDTDGQFEYSKNITVDLDSPSKFELSQNYPNPFNPSTTIAFTLPESGDVKLTVYNIIGENVSQIINGFKEAGVHTINFDGSGLNSGFYIYKLESNGLVHSKKMLLVK